MSDTELVQGPPGFADGTAFAPPGDGETAEAPETTAAVEAQTDDAPVEAEAVPAPTPEPIAPNPQLGILRDLQAERQARQEAQQEAARLRGQLEGIQLEQRRGVTPSGPAPMSAADVAKATTWAHRFGMYTTDGQPDVIAANNALNELRSEFSSDVDQRVNSRVQPVVQVLQQAHAQAKIAEIVRIGAEFGADPAILGTYAANLAQVQPDALSDQNVIVGLIGLARGMSSLGNTTPAPPATARASSTSSVTVPAPNLTNAPGGRKTVAPALSGIERTIAQKRGMSAEKWHNTAKDFERMDPFKGLVAED